MAQDNSDASSAEDEQYLLGKAAAYSEEEKLKFFKALVSTVVDQVDPHVVIPYTGGIVIALIDNILFWYLQENSLSTLRHWFRLTDHETNVFGTLAKINNIVVVTALDLYSGKGLILSYLSALNRLTLTPKYKKLFYIISTISLTIGLFSAAGSGSVIYNLTKNVPAKAISFALATVLVNTVTSLFFGQEQLSIFKDKLDQNTARDNLVMVQEEKINIISKYIAECPEAEKKDFLAQAKAALNANSTDDASVAAILEHFRTILQEQSNHKHAFINRKLIHHSSKTLKTIGVIYAAILTGTIMWIYYEVGKKSFYEAFQEHLSHSELHGLGNCIGIFLGMFATQLTFVSSYYSLMRWYNLLSGIANPAISTSRKATIAVKETLMFLSALFFALGLTDLVTSYITGYRQSTTNFAYAVIILQTFNVYNYALSQLPSFVNIWKNLKESGCKLQKNSTYMRNITGKLKCAFFSDAIYINKMMEDEFHLKKPQQGHDHEVMTMSPV